MAVKYPINVDPEDKRNRVSVWQETPDDDHYPSEKLVKDALDTLEAGGLTYTAEDQANKVSSWQTTPDHTHYPSEKLVKDALDALEAGGLTYTAEDQANKVSSWQTTPDDDHYPSEKLVKDNLDLKENVNNKVDVFQETPDDDHYPSEKLVKDYFDTKQDTLDYTPEDQVNKVTEWQVEPSDQYYPSEKLVKDTLDTKQDTLDFTPENQANKVATWQTTPDDDHYPSEKLVKDDLDTKQDTLGFTPENVANKITSWQGTPDDTHYPSEKLVKDSLNQITGTKNLIINGNFDFWSRGTVISSSDGNMGPDRWWSPGGNDRVQSVDTPDFKSRYSLKVARMDGTQAIAEQRIESLLMQYAVGQKITISGWVKTTGESDEFIVQLYYPGAYDNHTQANLWKHDSFDTVRYEWQYFSITTNVLPAGFGMGLRLRLMTPADSADFAEMVLSRIQVEIGEVATDFEARLPQIEAMLCQRYFCKTYPTDVSPGLIESTGALDWTAGIGGYAKNGVRWQFPTLMFTVPTVTIYPPQANGEGQVVAGKIYDIDGGTFVDGNVSYTNEHSCLIRPDSSVTVAEGDRFQCCAIADAEIY